MDIDEFKAFMQERLLEIDSNIDIEDGSLYDTELIQPVIDFLGAVPQEGDPYEFVIARMQQAKPSDLIDRADALADMAGKPIALILDPIFWELSRIKNSLTFRFPTLLTREAAQNLGANFFIEMLDGDTTFGTVRLYFSSPISLSVNGTNIVSTVNGDTFVPAFTQSITQNDMFYNKQGLFYYWDITVKAMEPGSIEVGPNEIISIEGIDAAVKVTNLDSFSTGAERETVPEYVERARDSLTERSITTAKGASARIGELYTNARNLEVAGYNDIEMARDILDIRGSGDRARISSHNTISFPLTLPGGVADVIVVETDDGAGGSSGPYTLVISGTFPHIAALALTINSAWVSAGGRGTIASSWGEDRLLLHSWTMLNQNYTHLDSYVKLIEPPMRQAYTKLGYTPLQIDEKIQGTSGFIVSSMPGGILRPNTINGSFSSEDLKYHIGGCTDFFLRSIINEKAEAPQPDAEDVKLAWLGTELVANPNLPDSDRVKDESNGTRPGRADWTQPLHVEAADIQIDPIKPYEDDFIQDIQIEPGDLLTIRNDSNIGGTYVIAATKTQDAVLDAEELRVNKIIPGGRIDEKNFHVSVSTRMDLADSKRRVKINSAHGTGLQCYGAVDTVSWFGPAYTGLDTNSFVRYGVAGGDRLRIYSQVNGKISENAGLYTILEVSGSSLRLDAKLKAVERVMFMIYEEGESSIDFPLVRVSQVDVLDAQDNATGITVPYALPVLIQSKGLAGARVRLEGRQGILSTANAHYFAIPPTYRKFSELGVKQGDVVTFAHATAFATGVNQIHRTIAAITGDYELSFIEPLPPMAPVVGNVYSDVYFILGTPARGPVRMYFQEPVSFEVQTQTLYDTSQGMRTSDKPFVIGPKDEDDGVIRMFFEPRETGLLGGRRIYPALSANEDPERWNVDPDFLPSFATDMELAVEPTSSDVKLLFNEMKTRENLLLPSQLSGSLRVGGDNILIFAERMLGQLGTTTSYVPGSNLLATLLRRSFFYCCQIRQEEPDTLLYPPNSFFSASWPKGFTDDPLTANSIEGSFGQLEDSLVVVGDSPDGTPSPNKGNYRVSSVPSIGVVNRKLSISDKGATLFTLTPTDELVGGCGRASWDQYIVTVASSAGFMTGETVKNGSITGVVADIDTGNKLILEQVSEGAFPTSGNWVGQSSGTTSAHVAVEDPAYMKLDVVAGKNTITFERSSIAVVAPGYIPAVTPAVARPGPWQVGAKLAIFGTYGTLSLAGVKADIGNQGVWEITSVSTDGKTVEVDNVKTPAKLFNTAGTLTGWVVSTGDRPLEYVGIYDPYPRPFIIDQLIFETVPPNPAQLFDGLLQVYDPSLYFQNYLTGRAYGGNSCPYQIARPGRTRISSTEMAENEEDELYYMDIDVVSQGPDPDHNLELDTYMFINNKADTKRGAYRGENNEYNGEGYVLEVADSNLTYSVQERLMLCMNPRILKVGDVDLESKKRILSSVGVGVRYDRSTLVDNVDAFVTNDSERTLCSSILVRHHTPAYVRLGVNMSGVFDVAELSKKLKDHIETLSGSLRLEVSDLEALMHKTGVDYIDQNFALVALFHDLARNITGERSRDFIGGDEDVTSRRLTTNRISHFISDLINLTKL